MLAQVFLSTTRRWQQGGGGWGGGGTHSFFILSLTRLAVHGKRELSDAIILITFMKRLSTCRGVYRHGMEQRAKGIEHKAMRATDVSQITHVQQYTVKERSAHTARARIAQVKNPGVTYKAAGRGEMPTAVFRRVLSRAPDHNAQPEENLAKYPVQDTSYKINMTTTLGYRKRTKTPSRAFTPESLHTPLIFS